MNYEELITVYKTIKNSDRDLDLEEIHAKVDGRDVNQHHASVHKIAHILNVLNEVDAVRCIDGGWFSA